MKKVAFGAKPQEKGKAITPEDWVSGAKAKEAETEPMKRLTIDVPESLHRRVKVQCATQGVKIADEVRRLLETHFPDATP